MEKFLILPSRVTEYKLDYLLSQLAEENSFKEIKIDFAQVKFYIPMAITAIVAIIRKWVE